MRIPHSDLKTARNHARIKAEETGHCWYVNRLASSGRMRYEVADVPITDTSFGGGLISTIHTVWCAINQPTLTCTCQQKQWQRVYRYLGEQLFAATFHHRSTDPIIQNLMQAMLLIARQNEVAK